MLQRNWPTWCSTWVTTSALGISMLTAGTGCSLIEGLTDSKARTAGTEAAAMQTVVRRADVARATVVNVERIVSNLPVDTDSKWVTGMAFKKSDAEPLMKDIANDPEYGSPDGKKYHVMHAEAWAVLLSKVCSTEKGKDSLYAELNPDLHTQYLAISAQSKNVGQLKGDIQTEKDALDDDSRASEKADHETKKKDLEDKLQKLQDDYQPKVDAFKKKLEEETAKASPELKKQIASTVYILRKALTDATSANRAAAIGYPLAIKGIKDEAKPIIKRIAADTLQAQIGTRPNMEKLAPEFKLSPLSVTIGGLAPSDIGKLKLEDATKDIADRSVKYLKHVVTLLGFIDETREMLGLQKGILEVLAKGVGETPVGEDFGDLEVTSSVVLGKGSDKRFMVPQDACVVPKAPEPPPDPPKPADPPPPDPKDKKKGKFGTKKK